uniref:Uncharacterized protein n=1 Tax=Rhizophora mucronata TaxID=61149 RepID=A0A2P2N5C8_RHIMU
MRYFFCFLSSWPKFKMNSSGIEFFFPFLILFITVWASCHVTLSCCYGILLCWKFNCWICLFF